LKDGWGVAERDAGSPRLFRDHVSVPTIPALARARSHLDKKAGRDVTLIITGGLRMPGDFTKAMALSVAHRTVGPVIEGGTATSRDCPSSVTVKQRF
jgi:glutamate synthase domain-containing protein 2